MKHYLLTCACQARIPVTAGQAGGRVRCPACGTESDVPRLGDLARLDALVESRHAAGRWGAWHAIALAGAVAAAVAGLIGAGITARARALSGIDAERMLQAVAATDVGEIHRSMDTFARRGIVRELPPPEQALLRHADWLFAMARAAWGVAVAGGVLALGAGLAAALSGPGRKVSRQRGPGA